MKLSGNTVSCKMTPPKKQEFYKELFSLAIPIGMQNLREPFLSFQRYYTMLLSGDEGGGQSGFHMALLCVIGPVVAQFFILTETARQYLILMLLFPVVYVFAYSVNTVIVCGIFPAGGDARYDAVSVLFASWCFAIPLALLGTFVFRLPVIAVYVLINADEIVKLPWLYPRCRKYLWLNNLTRKETDVVPEK